MKSRTARISVSLLVGVLTMAGARGQSHPQDRTSPSASPAGSGSQKQASGLRHELRANNTLRVHVMASPQSGGINIELLSATQIPAGPYGSNCLGYPSCAQTISPYPAVLGDFLGNGGQQVAAVVQAHHQSGTKYAISVEVPGPGGTFTPTLTIPTTQPLEFDPIFVGSLLGDGVDDLVMIHQPATYEVFLNNRNGTGTFTSQGTNIVTTTLAVGGTLTTDATTGCQDLLLVDGSNPGNVWTALGQTTSGKCNGTFSAKPPVALSLQLSSSNLFDTVVFGNFSNHTNGQLDFAGNAASDNAVNVFINNGSGTSYAATPLTTPDSAYDSCFNTAGELSGNLAYLDLVSANCFDNNVTVYVNSDSAGAFAQGVYYGVFGAPSAVGIANLRGSTEPNDIVSVNTQSSDVAILLGNGNGTVGTPSVGFVTGGRPQVPAVVTKLFSTDQYPDLVVPDNEFSFAYLQGYGDGTFRSGIDYYAQTGNGPLPQGSSIATGDFNGDGIPDFVIGNTNNNSTAGITVFLSNPDGTLQPGVNYSNPNIPSANLQYVAVADFNGDGKLDIAATDSVNGGVQIFIGNGDGTFATPTNTAEIPTDTGTYTTLGIVAANFTTSTLPDIAVVNDNSSTGYDVGVILNTSTGGSVSFGNPANTAPLAGSATTVTAGNLVNGQFLLVPVYGASTPVVATFPNKGSGTFGTETDVSLTNAGTGTVYYNPYAVAVGDLNGDGIPDLAVSIQDQTNFNQGIAILLGASNGSFGGPSLLNTTLQDPGVDNPIPASVVIADMNGDGIPDLAYTNSKFGTAGILYGEASPNLGQFYDPVEFPASRWAYNLAVTDLNGVGSKDVVVAGWVNSLDFSGVTVLLNTGDTGTSVASSAPSGSIVGNSVTFTATVIAKVKGITGPSNQGTVTFYAGSTQLGTPVPLSSGQAALQTNSLAVGSNSITAVYSGDGGTNFLPSTSSPLTQTVGKASDATSTPVGSPNPAQPKQSVTFTVAVTATNSPLPPTGIVTFYDGGNEIGTGTLNSHGQAGLTTSFSVVGLHSITAVYGGDSNFNGSTSPALNQQIGRAGTTTTVVSSINPALPTQIVTFTATVTSAVSGLQVVPGGTVTFYNGTQSIGTGTLNSSQQAALPVSGLALGTHSITVVYGGDTNFTDSTSPVLNQVVEQVGTTTALASSLNPAPVKQSVTFTATVAASRNGLPVIPSGTVAFNDGKTLLGTGTLSSGTAQFSTSSLAVGAHSITAVYSGDSNFTGSTSPAVNESVAVPDYTLSANPTSQTVNPGSSAKYTITLTPSTGYDGAVTFSCPATLPSGVACSFLPNPLTPTGTPPFTSVLTITTTAPSSAMVVPADVNAIHGNLNLLASLSAIGLMGLVLTGDWQKRKLSGRFVVLAVIALVMIMAWAGCGGGSSSTTTPPPSGGTPAGTYAVQVTGTGTAGTNGGSTSPQPLPITLVVE